MTGPLSHLRVIELGRYFSAPWAGQLLADMGCEVIKVESQDGDVTRKAGGFPVKDAQGRPADDWSTFVSVNRNKKSIVVNLKSEAGLDVMRRLAARSDVLLENFKAGDLDQLGLGYEALRAVNPGLVYLSLSGFGQTGPYRERPAMDTVVQAMSGYLALTARDGGDVRGSPIVVNDFAAGMYAVTGIMTALYHRDVNGGAGQYIDLSLLEAGIAMLSLSLQSFLLAAPGEVSASGGARFAPIGLYEAYDGRFQIAIGPQADFRRFAAVIERPDLADNPDYASLERRIANRLALEAEVVPAFLGQNLQTWLDRFAEANVMFSPVYNYEQMMADPQVRSRDVFITTRHQMGGDVKMIRNPLRMSETPIETYASPPLLGEHTDAVLRDVLGLDEAQIAALHASGAVRSGRVKATAAL